MSGARQVEFLARAIVNRLEDRGLVEFSDAEAGISVVTRTLADLFGVYDAVEQEARTRLGGTMKREPSTAEVEEEMRRVAAEKNILL
jgi:hypothetical protein